VAIVGQSEFTLSLWRRGKGGGGPLEGVALKIWTFLGPNGTLFARDHFRAQKSLDFQGPPLPMTLEIDFLPSKSLRPAACKQQVH
jgi:hypothetical protein